MLLFSLFLTASFLQAEYLRKDDLKSRGLWINSAKTKLEQKADKELKKMIQTAIR